MLAITLNEGDYVMIGDNIRVHFDHKISRDSLSLGIEAPRDVPVLRKKHHEQAASASPKPPTRTKRRVST